MFRGVHQFEKRNQVDQGRGQVDAARAEGLAAGRAGAQTSRETRQQAGASGPLPAFDVSAVEVGVAVEGSVDFAHQAFIRSLVIALGAGVEDDARMDEQVPADSAVEFLGLDDLAVA